MKMDISNEEILEELFKEFNPEIPDNAVTISEYVEYTKAKGKKIGRTSASRRLWKKVEEEGWKHATVKNTIYFWPPE